MAIRFLPLVPTLLLLLVIGAAPAEAASLDDFGSCLTRSGATFYGTSWCPACRRQKEKLGEAMRRVRYVECADASEPKRTMSECKSAQIEGYPTWVFGDRSRVQSGLSLASLAKHSGCALPEGAPPDAPAAANRHAPPAANPPPPPRGHVKIIEIPQR